jgi:membrane associated rhomboid family serine protease
MRNITETVKHLIIINIIFYVGSELIGDMAKDNLSLFYFESTKFKVWQFVSYMFMHGGIMHIAFNMFALYSFGSMLEQMWGSKKFIFFYVSCGIGAALLHTGITYYEIHSTLKDISSFNLTPSEVNQILNLNYKTTFDADGQLVAGNIKTILERVNCTQEQFNVIIEASANAQIPMVGASGAIYGLLVAFAFMFPNAGLMLLFIPFPVKAKYFVPGILLIDLFLGLKGNSIFGGGGTGVAHFAHIGGALIGFLMMWFWKKNEPNANRWN